MVRLWVEAKDSKTSFTSRHTQTPRHTQCGGIKNSRLVLFDDLGPEPATSECRYSFTSAKMPPPLRSTLDTIGHREETEPVETTCKAKA